MQRWVQPNFQLHAHTGYETDSMPKYKICILLLFQTCFFVVDEFLTPYVSDGKGRACVLATCTYVVKFACLIGRVVL